MGWKFRIEKTPLTINKTKTQKAQKKTVAYQKSISELAKHGEEAIKNIELTKNLAQNLLIIKELFSNCYDLVIREFTINSIETKCFIAYIDKTVKNEEINNSILKPLMEDKCIPNTKFKTSNLIDIIKETIVHTSQVIETNKFDEILAKFLNGYCILFVDGNDSALVLDVNGWELRKTSESIIEPVLRGPAEGFVESVNINTSLIRKKVKTPKLKLESIQLGRISKTIVIMAYIDGLANEGCIEEVRQRLKKIDIDMIIESGHIEQLIEDAPLSPFPQMEITERPDSSVIALSQGRIVILIDGTPFVLIVPAVFSDFVLSVEDNYAKLYFAPFIILFRYFAFLMALLGPSIYVAITTFHSEMIPFQLLETIASTREGLPFPAFIEALLMELTFELLREAGERLPRDIGQSLSIVGTLIIGQSAIQAGLVSPAMIVVISITAICSFVNPRLSMSRAIRIIRFPMLFLAGCLGIFGIIMGVLVLLLHMISLRSIGVPYFSPFAPIKFKDWSTAIFKLPAWYTSSRPSFIQKNNILREKADAKPKPPNSST